MIHNTPTALFLQPMHDIILTPSLTVLDLRVVQQLQCSGPLCMVPPKHLVEELGHTGVQLQLREGNQKLNLVICVFANLGGRTGEVCKLKTQWWKSSSSCVVVYIGHKNFQ